MQNFNYENASKIIFGKNDESVLATEIKKLGVKKVLIHFGQSSVVKSGLLDKIKTALQNAKIGFVEFGGVKANPLRSHAQSAIETAKKNKVDFILAVGGGSVIDSAKMVAAGAVNADIWQFYTNKTKTISNALPFGVVLTIPAAGSECSTGSVIVDDETKQKFVLSHPLLRSKFAFINPVYCFSLPKQQIANGASDILAHLLERYFSPDENIMLSDKLLTGAMQTMFEVAPKVFKNAENYNAMAEFCLLGTLAHNGMLALGRVNQAWESHPIEMAVCSGPNDIAHGAGLAIIFPAWLKFVGKKYPEKVLQFAQEVMGETTIEKGIAKLEKFYKSLQLATTLKDVGIKTEEAKQLARRTFSPNIILGAFGKLSIEDIENIITLAGGEK